MKPNLSDIPETMLWTLHNRASEAMRPDGCLDDRKCIEIYQSIEYDYEASFGKADGTHGVRSLLFDDQIRDFIEHHPDAVIVNLAEGLETTAYRIEAPDVLWISVDLPQAIEIREQFIHPDSKHIHLAQNALDLNWFNEVPNNRPVFITAQGLFMYFHPEQVAFLLAAMAKRFPGSIVMFDYVNVMLSELTRSPKGWVITPHYRTPPMYWGINRNLLEPTISAWIGQTVRVHNVPFTFPRGIWSVMVPLLELFPHINNIMPGICWFTLPQRKAQKKKPVIKP